MNLALPSAAIVALVIAGAAAAFSCHPNPKVQQEHASAVTAVAQDSLNRNVTAADRQTEAKTLHITVTAQEAAHDVEAAQGADAPVPPDVLARWGAHVDSLRAHAAAAHAGAAGGDFAGGAAPAVPAH